jgi:hypothetical protein
MKFFKLLALSFLIVAWSGLPARAEPKPWIWSWWPGHWDKLDFEPYLEPSKPPHNSQWDKSVWRPEDWIAQRKDEMDLIRGFYSADIVRDQYIDDEMPVLEVGPAFYMLGGEDKRRVTQTIDHVYEITEKRVDGMYLLYDWRTKEAIGTYTQYGLQLQ